MSRKKRKMSETPNAVGYCRVSLTKQVEKLSLEAQEFRIQEYCTYRHLNLVKVYKDEGISGGQLNRPALTALLQELVPETYVIVVNLSRLARSLESAMMILKTIREKNCYLVSIEENIDFNSYIGKATYNILSVLNELQREQIADRVSNNLKMLSQQNLLRSRPPFGYKFVSKDEPFAPNEEQQKVIKIIVALFKRGLNYNQIAQHLNERGYNKCLNSKEGDNKIFYRQTVKNILADQGLIKATNRKPLSQRFLDSRRRLANG
jgi:site-specific DNA recombinase